MKRIAILMPGGVAHPTLDIHIPSLYQLVSRLSHSFDITVYSLVTFGSGPQSARCGNAVVKFIPAYHEEHWTKKIFLLSKVFSRDHRTDPFHLVHGMLGVTTELTTILLSKFYRLPSIISLLGGETANIPQLKYGSQHAKLLALLTRYICREAQTLTVLTNFQAKELPQLRVVRNHIPVIPFGVDVKVFHPVHNRTPKAPYRFLHVSNIIPLKDQETLLQAFKLILQKYDAQLRIAGTDHSHGKLQERIRALGLGGHTELIGYLPHDELANHFQWADILLHTSLHEAQGVVVAEAAACGAVICGTRVGLIHDFETDKALAVAPGDATGLARCVSHVLENFGLFKQLRTNALQWAQQYDINWTVNEFRSLYQELLRS